MTLLPVALPLSYLACMASVRLPISYHQNLGYRSNRLLARDMLVCYGPYRRNHPLG
jgi:hypothetical protein